MTTLVYHANATDFCGTCPCEFPREFTLVARISECPTLGAAFELTNHINRAWWENPGVERVGPPCRSTSVGDVVVFEGVAYRCELVGWSKIGPVAP